jgi:RNA polymerase sigma-70 factor (ECF subfamily)
METTPVSLLQRLRQPGEQQAWQRFTELYTPLLYYWTRRLGLQPQDAADLVQEVFILLVRKLPQFTYDQHKSFRAWLRTVTLNKWRDICRRRTQAPLADADPAWAGLVNPDHAAEFEEAEYQQFLLHRALEIMQAEFEPVTWKACWEYVVANRPVADVAAELHISVGSVYVAKSRVLRRLRQELEGLLS